MRTKDLRGGSLKALLILLLIAANIFAAVSSEKTRNHSRPALAPVRAETLLLDKQPH